METNYDKYRAEKLEEGKEYQDYVCERLHKHGIVLQNMTSRKHQYKRENMLGLEIKKDNLFPLTGRVYIETHEKAVPREGDYALAGINRNDNSWLYGVGNEQTFFIFSKTMLRRLLKKNPPFLFHPKPTDTSIGFCIPVDAAKQIACKVIEFQNERK